jgi:mannitol/fructose-specific phosphotransferase system IIA component
MVTALVNLSDKTNQALNVVKARNNLKDKGAAIEYVVKRYIEEPEVRLEFVARIEASEKQPSIAVKSFGARYGI